MMRNDIKRNAFVIILLYAFSSQALLVGCVKAGGYKLIKSTNIELCNAYQNNLNENNSQNYAMACERNYSENISGFKTPVWRSIDVKSNTILHKNLLMFVAGNKIISDSEMGNAIKRAEKVELNYQVTTIDLKGDGKLQNVLAVRTIECGPYYFLYKAPEKLISTYRK